LGNNINNRKKIPAKIQKLLQKEINSRCPICGNEEVDHFQIHHIDEDRTNNEDKNLIMLCPICHSKVNKGDINKVEILNLKNKLILNYNKIDKPTPNCNIININSGIKESVIGNVINVGNMNIKGKTKPKMNYAEGTIGTDMFKKNYVKHLIDKYNDYTKDDNYKPNFSFAVIFKIINKQFGASCYNIPIIKFDDLCNFLQNKIRNTRLGRILNSRGQKLFSTFEEYVDKYCK
jgi:endogenous inhibitor of DNA gyrase (YacG/DUF329 family)